MCLLSPRRSCRLFVIALLFFIGVPAFAGSTSTTDAVVYTTNGELMLHLEITATPHARETGLMNRDSLKPYDGMLFLFPIPGNYKFWMKNTHIPLDMIFIDDHQTVAYIERNVPPYSLKERGGAFHTQAVIELDGGRSQREGVAVGDKVRYELPPSVSVE